MDNRTKNILIYALLGVMVGLVIWVVVLRNRPEPTGLNEELIRSEERVRALEQQGKDSEAVVRQLLLVQDSLDQKLSKTEEEREYFRKKYYYEKKRVSDLSIDDGVEFLSGWLSESDTL